MDVVAKRRPRLGVARCQILAQAIKSIIQLGLKIFIFLDNFQVYLNILYFLIQQGKTLYLQVAYILGDQETWDSALVAMGANIIED